MFEIVEKYGWKYEVYIYVYFMDVMEVLDLLLIEGNLLLDFIIYIVNFWGIVDEKLV